MNKPGTTPANGTIYLFKAALTERPGCGCFTDPRGSIQSMDDRVIKIGGGDKALEAQLSDELDRFNASQTPEVATTST